MTKAYNYDTKGCLGTHMPPVITTQWVYRDQADKLVGSWTMKVVYDGNVPYLSRLQMVLPKIATAFVL